MGLRLRVVFDDVTILNKTQRSDGMSRTWLFLKSQQHRTISDVCNHLLHIFKLHRSCPNGIILSMEGFALPPFESTEILQDKEIISVKKKGGATIEATDGGNLLCEGEDEGLDPGDNGLLLLGNDNKGTGDDHSESEEIDEQPSEDEESPEEAVTKKRKATTNLQNLKKKKRCLEVLDDDEDDEIENVNNDASHSRKVNSKETNKSAAVSNKKVKAAPSLKRSEQLQENVEEGNQVSAKAAAVKKMPSRSARRKKAKRQWMQELAKIAKRKNVQPHPYSKPEVTKAESKQASKTPVQNGRPKGLLHWKQASKNPVQNGDVGPIVSRPGHIRFEHLDEDQSTKQTRVSNETTKWNGSSSKRRGQKGGREKFYKSQRNDRKRLNTESFKMLFKDTQVPIIDPNDFDKLPPCCEPKEGDVIAYRLLELNSSWIPEFSSYRVGRISYYDARDIVLIPVTEYPIDSEKINEDGPNGSLYGEDGTLEINYSALVDVRNLKQYEPDATEAASNGGSQTPLSVEKDAAANLVSNSNDNKIEASKDSNPGDGEVTPWDRFSKVNHEVNHSSVIVSVMNPCSYGAAGPSTSAAPEANRAKSSEEKDGQKGNSLDPWLNANKPEPSQERAASWTDIKKTGPSENNCETGSSWGRPWSTFVVSRSSSVKQPNQENSWQLGSSRGNGRPWSRGAPRGRGRGRGCGRGRGRKGNMM